MRTWFEGEGFLEVETPLRVFNPGQELHLDAIAAGEGRFLITSPEYHMKRLVGGGLGRIFQLGRSFRAGERGPHHEPEFTMLEWYRAHEPLDRLMQDCEQILAVATEAVRGLRDLPVPPGRAAGPAETISLVPPFERSTVCALVRQHAGIELSGDETVAELREKITQAGISTTAQSWDDLFFQVFLDRVEPHLGHGRPTFVCDWPLPLGALARRRADDSRLVERFELYAGGLELVNAFGELTDPVEQRARFLAENAARARAGKVVYPMDEPLLAALERMPPTCGAALGFDRLVMLVLGAEEIRDVVAFADDEV